MYSRLVVLGLAVVFAVLATGCPGRCRGLPLRDFLYYYPQKHYSITPNVTTPKGIAVDMTGGPAINLKRVDRLFDEVEACLIAKFGNPPALPDDVRSQASCVGKTFPVPLVRSCITVKIARDWFVSSSGTQQLLPIEAGAGCTAKGETPPCYWRAIIQDPLGLVVPPSMYLLKDVLIRVTTGCLNPWAPPAMAACAMPTTGPLDDGTGD